MVPDPLFNPELRILSMLSEVLPLSMWVSSGSFGFLLLYLSPGTRQ